MKQTGSSNKTVARGAAANSSAAAPGRRYQNSRLKGSAVGRSANAVDMEVAHEICAITNPFCPASRGSKWPDESSGSTLAVPVRQRLTITTDAQGEFAQVYTPIYPYGIVVGGNVSGEFTGTTAAAYLPVNSTFLQYRVVSGGVQWTSTCAPMSATGVANMIEILPGVVRDDTGIVNSNVKSYPSYETLPLRCTESLFGVFRQNGIEARQFFPAVDAWPALGTDEYSTHDMTSIGIFISGGPASTVVGIIDIYINLEVLVDISSSYSYLMTQPRLPNPGLTRASNILARGGAIRSGTERSNDQSWIEDALGYLRSGGRFVRKYGGTVFGAAQLAASLYSGNVGGAVSGGMAMLGNGPSMRSRYPNAIDVD